MSYKEDIKKFGITAQGMNELISHHNGKKLTYKQAVRAKCYDCMGYFQDGKTDCKVDSCPLYQHYPYRNSNNDV